MAVTQRKDGRWIVYYRTAGADGKKSSLKVEYFGRGSGAEARARLRDKELVQAWRRPANPAVMGPAFGDLAEEYAKNKYFNPNSSSLLKIRLYKNIFPFFEKRIAIRISDTDLDAFVKKRRSGGWRDPEGRIRNGVKDSTIAREITDIKAILNWSAKRRPPLIPHNPIRDYKKPPEDNAVIPPPTRDELRWIIDASSCHLFRAIFLSYYLGLRPGTVELLQLTWDDYDHVSQQILITSARKGGPGSRRVPVHPDLAPVLEKWRLEDEKTGPIIHYNGRPVKSLKKAWWGALDRAGITRRLRMYDLRHQFVTAALEHGADIKGLAEIVGSSPETLRRHYQHVTAEIHRQIIAKIPPII